MSGSENIAHDQLAIIRIEGMHCHRCEQAIQRSLNALEGVHEVEVDFASGQASILYDRANVQVRDLMNAIEDAGYHATGFTQQLDGQSDRSPSTQRPSP